MNHFQKLAKPKHRKPIPPQSRSRNGARFTAWHWTLIGLCLILAGEVTLAVADFLVWNKVPPALVGRWQMQVGGDMATFEFFRNGIQEVRVNNQKPLKGRVVVENRSLFTTTVSPGIRGEETRKSLIRELTATSLVLELESGEVLKMVRGK